MQLTCIHSLKIVVIFFVLVCFFSCQQKTKHNEAVLKALTESVSSSNKQLQTNNSLILSSLKGDANDITSMAKATSLFAQAKLIDSLTNTILSHIQKLKQSKIITKSQADILTKR
jgi:hypothetical protein